MSQCILEAERITMRYGRNTVLSNASIHVEKGAIYGLVGRNGSGKTTLLRILTGLIQDFGGAVRVARTGARESRFAAVISDPSLFLNMSASENMREQTHLLGLRDEGRVGEGLRAVGLANHDNRSVSGYSLGMKQRLKLAMALLQKPDILILDEPMNGLDPDGIVDLRELLLALNAGGMTILISSHMLSELEQVATCLGVLHGGRIAKEVSARNAFRDGSSLERLYIQCTRGGQSDD